MHCHTLASAHAYSTIQEMAAAARKRGLMAIAVTDHGITMEDAPHPWYFQNQKVLPRVIEGVNVLKGMEANILDGDGNLDIREEALRGLEWVVASIHYGVPENDKEACTNAWFQVAKKDFVRVIGHSGTLNIHMIMNRLSRNLVPEANWWKLMWEPSTMTEEPPFPIV